MKKYSLLLLLASTIFLLNCNNFVNKEKKSKPNFIIIVADDAGYSDIGFFGSEIATPTLDIMAKNGIVFPNFYNFSRCSPSRASLMTGLYPQRVGMGELSGKSLEYGLPGYLGYLGFEHSTIAEILEKNGYHNMMCGKWHLGNELDENKTPLGRGFHDFFGLNSGEASHFKCNTEKPKYYLQDKIFEDCNDNFYSSDMFADMAIQFLEKNNGEKPFLLYLPYTAPHHPIEAPIDIADKYRKVYSTKRNIEKATRNRVKKLSKNIDVSFEDYVYPQITEKAKKKYLKKRRDVRDLLATRAAMIEVMDTGIGRIMNYLEDKSIDDNTIIFYFSDNGGGSATEPAEKLVNAPYKGMKASLQEGGIKTPLIIYGKDIPTGKVNNNIVSVMDIFPSILSIAGISFEQHQNIEDKYKGIDISQTISNNKKAISRKYLFWDLYGQQAVIKNGRWKWINDKSGEDRLFDIKNDPLENNNVALTNKPIVQQMKKSHLEFRKANNVEPYPNTKRMKKRINRSKKN